MSINKALLSKYPEYLIDIDIEYVSWEKGGFKKHYGYTIEKVDSAWLRYTQRGSFVWIGSEFELGFRVKSKNVFLLS